MKKIKLFLITILILVVSFTGSVLGQDSAQELEEIQEFKDKLASKVAELQETDEKALAGFISEIKEGSININTSGGEEYAIELDDLLTKYFSVSGNSFNEQTIEDFSDGNYIIVTGPINGKIISANNIYKDVQYLSNSGIVSEINQGTSTLTIISLDNETYSIVVDSKTQKNIINIKTAELEDTTLAKIKSGDVVHFIFQGDAEEDTNNKYTASKILVVPQEYFSK